MARQVRFFQEELRKANVPAASLLPSDRAFDFDRMEGELLQLESELSQLTSNSERLRRSHNELLELQLVLERAAVFFSDARSDALATREDDEGRRGLGEGERCAGEACSDAVRSTGKRRSSDAMRRCPLHGVQPTPSACPRPYPPFVPL